MTLPSAADMQAQAETAFAEGATPPPKRPRTRKADTAEDADAELETLRTCGVALDKLDAAARGRVLLYLVRRYDSNRVAAHPHDRVDRDRGVPATGGGDALALFPSRVAGDDE